MGAFMESYMHSTSAPRCEASVPDDARVGVRRIVGVSLAVPCGTLLAIAAMLTPSASGRGTHRSLGLPACGTLAETGYPCPTCGMTTAVAWTVRGRVDKAFGAHAAGPLVAVALAVCAAGGAAQGITGRPILHRLRIDWRLLLALVVLVFAAWGVRTLVYAQRGIYPLR